MVEGKSNEHFVCTHTPAQEEASEALSTGVFDFEIEIKCAKLVGSDTNLLFNLVVGFQSQRTFYTIGGDAEDHVWTLHRYVPGQPPGMNHQPHTPVYTYPRVPCARVEWAKVGTTLSMVVLPRLAALPCARAQPVLVNA